MEGYILRGRNIAEQVFKKQFTQINGDRALKVFERKFRDAFITQKDFSRIAAMGATVVRVPFNCRLIETSPYHFSSAGLSYLIRALDWARDNKLKIILDLHAAAGSQNADWHGDSLGKALLWENASFRERTYALWEYIVAGVKDHPALHGYDVLNEPVLDKKNISRLTGFYREAVRRIKAIDNTHVIYLEGNTWAQQIDFLADIIDDGVAVSIHAYQPLTYTFNYTPGVLYPGKIENERWRSSKIAAYMEPYAKFSQKHNVEIFVGEFGINWRGGHFGELNWVDDILSAFDDFGFSYTYWTYKAVANNVFPDGIYQYMPNSPFVRREGPVYGWETYPTAWKKNHAAIIDALKTDTYTKNAALVQLLKKHFTLR